jgi:hypothetical protein
MIGSFFFSGRAVEIFMNNEYEVFCRGTFDDSVLNWRKPQKSQHNLKPGRLQGWRFHYLGI